MRRILHKEYNAAIPSDLHTETNQRTGRKEGPLFQITESEEGEYWAEFQEHLSEENLLNTSPGEEDNNINDNSGNHRVFCRFVCVSQTVQTLFRESDTHLYIKMIVILVISKNILHYKDCRDVSKDFTHRTIPRYN